MVKAALLVVVCVLSCPGCLCVSVERTERAAPECDEQAVGGAGGGWEYPRVEVGGDVMLEAGRREAD